MQACGGATAAAAAIGSVHQLLLPKTSINIFPQKGSNDFSHNYFSINFSKPSRFSFVSNSLVTGRPPSSVSVPAPEIGGLFKFLFLSQFTFAPSCCYCCGFRDDK